MGHKKVIMMGHKMVMMDHKMVMMMMMTTDH